MPASELALEVVIFNYNYARYLPDSLHGLEIQSRRPDMVRVSDDASPADPPDKLHDILAPFPWAKLQVNTRNLGAVEHFRTRIAEVSLGAYMILSADDFLMDPDFLADAMRILRDHPDIVVVYGQIRLIDDSKQPCTASESGWALFERRTAAPNAAGWTFLSGTTVRQALAFDNVMPAVCCVVRSSVHRTLPPFPIANPHCHDWQQWYLLTYLGNFARIERPVLAYRRHGNNLSAHFEQSGDALSHLEQAYRELLERPEVGCGDAALLRIGCVRKLLLGVPLRHLASCLWRYRFTGVGINILREAVYRRLSRRFHLCYTRCRDAVYSQYLKQGKGAH